MRVLEAPGVQPAERPATNTNNAPRTPAVLNPVAFFLGILLGFCLCCLAGYLTTKQNQFGDLPRFDQIRSPEALLQPTISQMRAIARARARTDQILVVVVGSSILNGCGQPAPMLWSKRLQEDLGPEYVVVNFAQRACTTLDGGYFAAESLAKEFKKLIVVTDAFPAACGRLNLERYDYQYYDGLYKGLLEDNAARDADFEQRIASVDAKEKEQWQELKLRKRLDSLFYFDDLWNTVGNRYLFTVWNFLALENFTKPRRKYPDGEANWPPRESFLRFRPMEIDNLKKSSTNYLTGTNGVYHPVNSAWQSFEVKIRLLSENMRKRILVVEPRANSVLYESLTTEERSRDKAFRAESCKRWRNAGYHAISCGEDWSESDYMDGRHMAPTGGVKLAEVVAPQIRSIAHLLGYTK